MTDSTILQSRNPQQHPGILSRAIAISLTLLGIAAINPPLLFGDPVSSEPRQARITGLAVDRKTTIVLESFRHQLAKADYNAATEDFRRLQTSDPATMVPADETGLTFLPLYRAAFDSFHQLPSSHRDRIAEPATAQANRILQQIIAESDYESLPDLILKFAGTEASLQAHILLARLHLDRGNNLGLKAWLTPLTLENVDDSYRQTALNILQELPGENKSGSAENPPGERSKIPDQLHWQFRAEVSQKVQEHLSTFMTAATAASITPQATWRDLIDGRTSYRRTLQGVAAIDLSSGQPRWQYPLEPQLDSSLAASPGDNSVFGRNATVNTPAADLFPTMERTALANLFCRDNITGQVADDSERLYVVANPRPPITSANTSPIGFRLRTSTSTFRGSQLIALEKSSGRRIWTAGSKSFEQPGKKPPGVWFAGVPRVSRNRLFSVVEWNTEISLACFAARTGELLWTTRLAWPEQSIDKDSFRQLRSATPTVQQGIIWCPTTAGWTLCVDEITRSILWANNIGRTQTVDTARLPRGQPVVMTPWSSVRGGWSVSTMRLAGDRLIILPHESHEILLLNAITGQIANRVPVKLSELLLHIDEATIVCSKESKIICRSTVNGDVRWSTETVPGALPTGQAVSEGNTLLLPMTTGAIIRVDLASGKIIETASDVLPQLAWGQLIKLQKPLHQGDLLYATPDRLIYLSANPSKSQPGKPIEIAAALLAAKKWANALQLAEKISVEEPGNTEAKAIRFECHVRLAAHNPETHLRPLKDMQKSQQQQAQVLVLEFEILLKQQELPKAASLIADILKLDPALLLFPSPNLHAPDNPHAAASNDTSTTVTPLHTWATSKLAELLDQIPDKDAILKQLTDVSTPVLLSLHHPAVLPIIHNRLRETTSHEATVQLLRHAVNLRIAADSSGSTDIAAVFNREVEVLEKMVSELQQDATPPTPQTALLNITTLEMPTRFSAAVRTSKLFGNQTFRSDQSLRQESRKQRTDSFAKWTADAYRIIPVARLRSFGRVEKVLSIAEPDDLFLSRFRWSATAGDYGRLQVFDIAENNMPRWSIPGNYRLHGTYSFQQDILIRAGTVLLLKSYASITAVSLLDQTVLWSRSFPYVAMPTPSGSANNFDRFAPLENRLPSQQLPSSFQVIGSGHGWLALTNGRNFSMIDIYTGRTLWSMKLQKETASIVASGNTVQVSSANHTVTRFSAVDGSRLPAPDVTNDSMTPIRNTENLFVCWKQSHDKHDPRLLWIDSTTNDVVHEIDLANMMRFQFVNDNTLAGFNEQRQVQIVDLKSRTSNTISFHPTEAAKTTSLPEQPTDKDTPLDLPFWDPARVQVATDGLSFYVCNRKRNNGLFLQSPANRHMMIFEGALIALDRETGKQQWEFGNSEVLMASTDQPELPIMLLIDASQRTADGQPTGRSIFYGVSKTAGKQVFKQSLPTQSSLRTLSLSSPAINILDIGVQGLRLRIETETSDR
jgi:outer membrane protein assembly factor BamB